MSSRGKEHRSGSCRFMKMEITRIAYWKLLLFAGALLVITGPAAASFKRVIVWERPDVGFPPLIKTLQEDRLKLAQSPGSSAGERVIKK